MPPAGDATISVGVSFRLSNFYFWYFAFVGVFGTYFALYLQSLGFAAGEIALLMSMQQLVRIFTPFFWGWLADRLSARTAIIRITLVLAAGAFSLLFLVTEPGAMAGVFVVMCSLWSAALPLFEANVIASVDGDSGRYGRIRLWGSVGFILAVVAAGFALDSLPMRSLLYMVLAMLLLAALSSRRLPEYRPGTRKSSHADSIWPILRRPQVIALFLSCFLMMASQSANFVFYSIYMVESGHSKSTVGMLWSIGVLAEIAIFLSLPRLNKRYTPYALFAFSFAMTALRFLLVGWCPASLAVQVMAQSFHAFTFGTWHAAAMVMLHQWFPAQFGTRGQALYTSFAFGFGGMAGGLAAGVAWSAVGPAWMFTMASGLAAIGWGISLRYVRSPATASI